MNILSLSVLVKAAKPSGTTFQDKLLQSCPWRTSFFVGFGFYNKYYKLTELGEAPSKLIVQNTP